MLDESGIRLLAALAITAAWFVGSWAVVWRFIVRDVATRSRCCYCDRLAEGEPWWADVREDSDQETDDVWKGAARG